MEDIRDGDWRGAEALAEEERRVRLRDVEVGDAGAYVRMRCDPAMTAELGGPLPREGIGLPHVFRTGELRLIHAAACRFRYSSRTSCGVL